MPRKSAVLIPMILALCINAYAAEEFRFAIIGDRTGTADQKVFQEVINEMSRHQADFAINIGDLIEGYTPDSVVVEAQWDTVLATLEAFKCPVHFVAGNHDIFDEQSARIYERRTGHKPYYSFDHQNAHFIVLSNAVPETWEDVGREQLSWLKEDLEKHKAAQPTFCFFHKPFWFEAFQKKEEDSVHDILKAHGVDCVLSGHYHQFCRTSWDGVTYVLIGSSGGAKGNNKAAGYLYGYAMVTVEDGDVGVTMLELGDKALPHAALSFEDVQTAMKIEYECVDIDPVEIRGSQPIEQTLALKVQNIYDEDFNQPISWTSSNPAWKVFPEKKIGHFPAKMTAAIHFSVENRDPSHLYPLPQLTFIYPTKGWGECRIEGPLPIVRSAKAEKIAKAPHIDGKLDDECWRKERLIGVLYGQRGEPTKAEPTEVYLAHDGLSLYLGVRCVESEKEKLTTRTEERDGATILGDDCILVYFDSENKKQRLHQLILNPAGQLMDQRCTVEGQEINRDRKWNGDWKIGLGEEENAWIAEIGVPFGLLEAEVQAGSVWGFNIGRIQPRVNDSATWQPYLSVHPDAYGKLILE